MARTNNKERKSTVKGIWANAQTQEFNQFEVETEYTRSIEKAVKLASAIINPDNNNAIMVSVTEIINEKQPRKVYDNAALYVECSALYLKEEDAKAAVKENETIVKGTCYDFNTNIWAYDITSAKYITEPFSWSTGANVTARDAREMFAMRYESMQENDVKVIGMHHPDTPKGFVKRELECWFAIDKETLEQHCVKQAKDAK